MLSRRLFVAARLVRLGNGHAGLQHIPVSHLRHVRRYADRIVKVPQMAESISEGTLKQWSKQVGDFVEQDEEIATIETDKVCQALFCAARRPTATNAESTVY